VRAYAIHMMRSILLLHIVILAATLHDEDTGSVICIHYLFVLPDRFSTKDMYKHLDLAQEQKNSSPGRCSASAYCVDSLAQ